MVLWVESYLQCDYSQRNQLVQKYQFWFALESQTLTKVSLFCRPEKEEAWLLKTTNILLFFLPNGNCLWKEQSTATRSEK